MHWIKRLGWRLQVLFQKRSAEAELDEEIRHHLEMEIRENMRAGMSRREARRQAMVAFGGVEKTKEKVRDVRGARGLDDFGQDLRLAVRKLKNAPGFAVAAVVILALGIGSTVTMFSLLDAAALRALPFPDSQELVMGRATFSGDLNPWCTFPDYLDYRDETDAFEVLASMLPGTRWPTVTGGDAPERVPTNWVTHDFFRALGVEPQLGRGFLPEEANPSAPPVVVVSHGFWQRWFGGAPEAVGSLLMVEGTPATVVGIMPSGFRFRSRVDLWMPVVMGTLDTEARRSHSWLILGRLKEGLGIQEAQGQVDVVSARLAEAYPDSHSTKGLRLTPLKEALAEGLRPALLILLGATGLLLLIACGNVAGLLVARATTRFGEMSLRAAIGATRQRLVRQLFTESLLLAGVAGGLGALLAIWLLRLVPAFVPLEEVGIWDVGMSGKMLGFAAALSFGTAILFGVGPALTASQVNPADDLKGGRRASGDSGSGRVRGWLVGAQVALSVVLLTGSGLLLRSFVRLQSVELGFPTENLVIGNLAISPAKYPDGPSRSEFFRGVLEDVRAMPGVVSASFIDMAPIRHRYRNWFIWDAEHPPEDREGRVSTYSRTVLPGYFETMGIPVLRGRDHADEDEVRDEPYLILSESAAREAFGDQDPVGRRVTVFNAVDEATFEVLGVVAEVRITEVRQAPEPQMYYHFPTRPSTRMNLVVRARGTPETLVPGIRRTVLDRDPDVPLSDVATMSSIVSESIAPDRILSVATGLFAVTALVLSLTGLYAVLAYYVALRSQEIGIRMAFGAGAPDVLALVLRKGMALVSGGLAAGILGAAIVTRALQSLLYQVTATDPVTFLGVALGFSLVGFLASWAPARKATRVDPVRAIQSE